MVTEESTGHLESLLRSCLVRLCFTANADMTHGKIGITPAGAAQHPPLPGSDTCGGGQLMAVLVRTCAAAADAATGGTPLTHFGLGQAPAAAAVRPSDPAVRAADMTAPAATRLA